MAFTVNPEHLKLLESKSYPPDYVWRWLNEQAMIKDNAVIDITDPEEIARIDRLTSDLVYDERRDGPVPFKLAIFATGLPPYQVRNWILRKLITLDANNKQCSRHRRFSYRDLVRLAVISRLTRFGFTAKEASDLIERDIEKIETGEILRLEGDWAILNIYVGKIREIIRNRLSATKAD